MSPDPMCCFHNNKVEHDLDLISEVLYLNLDSNSEDNKEINNIRPTLKEDKGRHTVLVFFLPCSIEFLDDV